MGYQFDRLRILVVDDNAHMRKLVSTILHAFGISQIIEAESGERAWALLRETNPDICVLDWMMDGMSGVDLVRKIRSDPQSPNPLVPVIMLTGHTQTAKVQEARDAGVNEFIVKPVSVRVMMQRLISVIETPRPFARTKSFFGPDRRRHHDADDKFDGPNKRDINPGAKAAG